MGLSERVTILALMKDECRESRMSEGTSPPKSITVVIVSSEEYGVGIEAEDTRRYLSSERCGAGDTGEARETREAEAEEQGE